MKGKFDLVRTSNLKNGEHVMRLAIECTESGIQFFTGEIAMADLMMAITGRAGVDIDFELRNTENVGKREVRENRTEVLPEHLTKLYGKDRQTKVLEWLKDMYEDGTTYVENYLGRQSSFMRVEEKEVVNFVTYHYEDLKEE